MRFELFESDLVDIFELVRHLRLTATLATLFMCASSRPSLFPLGAGAGLHRRISGDLHSTGN